MRIVFWTGGKDREIALADALRRGVSDYGHTVEIARTDELTGPRGDLGCIYGVKRPARKFFEYHLVHDVPFLFFDKSHTRQKVSGRVIYRVAVNGYAPVGKYFKRDLPSDRWDLHHRFLRDRQNGRHIMFAGSSQKHCDFMGLGDCTQYAEKVVAAIRKFSDRPIIYRPKPSWREAVPIDGTEFSTKDVSIARELKRCHALVTHSSNAAIDALIRGVPTFVLGEGVAAPVSSPSLVNLEDPYWPSDAERLRFLADVSYCQWSLAEYASGKAWSDILGRLNV